MNKEQIIQRVYNSACQNPITISRFDGVSHVLEKVQCGRCAHCRMTKVSEWQSRFYAAAAYHKNTYFITLTYRAFDKSTPKELLFETYATEHNFNYEHKLQLSPLVLCKRHVQLFFKRLRKRGFKFQYYCVGEYGSKYGRPHYHILLFTDQNIPLVALYRSWSFKGYCIGYIDCNNLSTNGTLDGSKSCSAFSYVCKYVQKQFQFNKLPTYSLVKDLISYLYGKMQFINELCEDGSQLVDVPFIGFEKFFSQYFGVFSLCSKRPALGFEYYLQHSDRFIKSDFRLLGLPKECTIFPTYYKRLAKKTIFPLQSFNSVSKCFCSPLFYKVAFDYVQTLSSLRKGYYCVFSDSLPSWSDRALPREVKVYNNEHDCVASFNTDYLEFYDSANSMYLFLSPSGKWYDLYKRKDKQYFKVSEMSFNEFVSMYSESFENLMLFLDNQRQKRLMSERLRKDSILREFGSEEQFIQEFSIYCSYRDSVRESQQLKYNNSKVLF